MSAQSEKEGTATIMRPSILTETDSNGEEAFIDNKNSFALSITITK